MISTQHIHNTPVIPHTHSRPLLTPTVSTQEYTPIVQHTSTKSHFPITPPPSTPASPATPTIERHSPPHPVETFEDLLAASELPPPGPAYYTARRALWLTPRSKVQPRAPEPSTSRQRLERLLGPPGAVEDAKVWNCIEPVWKGLARGGKLKRKLPMSLVVKIIHAAWLRDETWPVGAVVPDSDDTPQAPSHVYSSPVQADRSSELTAL